MAFTHNGKFKLPGYESIFDMSGTIGGVEYFTWAEALHYEGTGYFRRPESKEIVDNILRHAKHLGRFREHLGHPLIITSWYRDPVTNKRVGGASKSMHVQGLASDLYCPSMSIRELKQEVVKFGWFGGRGYYSSFIHLDSGKNREWYG